MEQDYFPLTNSHNVDCPKENLEVGPWFCKTQVDWKNGADLLEMHPSEPGTGIVFRISTYYGGRIDLGECVILDKPRAITLRDRLNSLIERLS